MFRCDFVVKNILESMNKSKPKSSSKLFLFADCSNKGWERPMVVSSLLKIHEEQNKHAETYSGSYWRKTSLLQ